jgi:hypothetical protein
LSLKDRRAVAKQTVAEYPAAQPDPKRGGAR